VRVLVWYGNNLGQRKKLDKNRDSMIDWGVARWRRHVARYSIAALLALI